MSTTDNVVPRVLEGWRATGSGGGLLLGTCLRHLADLGADVNGDGESEASSGRGRPAAVTVRRGGGQGVVECTMSLGGPMGGPYDDATVQALCGLMELHGRNRGHPRRLGVEFPSVAAAVLGTQGILAGLLAGLRLGAPRDVETSAVQASLTAICHYIACATSGDPEWAPPPPASEPGPPFRTADGHWFELEVLDGDTWKAFWAELGVGGPEVGRAWMLFMPRYLIETGSLPPGLHAATSARSLADVTEAARRAGASVVRLRSYPELLDELVATPGAPRVPPPWVLRPAPPGAPPPGAAGPDGPPPLPLAGLHVVEVTRRLQGPFAGMLLQFLGAEVTRVEPPWGDAFRMLPPMAGDTSASFLAFNRGKRVVELDAKKPAGRAALLDLVAGADVFLQNWAPGKAAELRLDHDDLAAVNPALVYAYASGWGDALGPRPPFGTEQMVQAHTALGDALNPADEPPFPTLLTLTDVMGALTATEGILAGLVHRERSGSGCRVDTSLLSGAMVLQAHVLEAYAAGRESGRQAGRPTWGPLDRPSETADGYLMVRADGALPLLCDLTDVEPEPGGQAATEKAVAERLRERPALEWERLLRSAGIACAAVCTDLTRLPADPALAPLFQTVNGCSLPNSPWRFT